MTAFSADVYGSINSSIKEFTHFSKHKELKEDGSVSASENLVFEETENDTEDSVDPLFILLPSFLSIDSFTSVQNNDFIELHDSEKPSSPIFLSIRVLKI